MFTCNILELVFYKMDLPEKHSNNGVSLLSLMIKTLDLSFMTSMLGVLYFSSHNRTLEFESTITSQTFYIKKSFFLKSNSKRKRGKGVDFLVIEDV